MFLCCKQSSFGVGFFASAHLKVQVMKNHHQQQKKKKLKYIQFNPLKEPYHLSQQFWACICVCLLIFLFSPNLGFSEWIFTFFFCCSSFLISNDYLLAKQLTVRPFSFLLFRFLFVHISSWFNVELFVLSMKSNSQVYWILYYCIIS